MMRVHLECARLVAQLAICRQQQFAVGAMDTLRQDHPLRAPVMAIEIIHQHRSPLLQSFFQFHRQQQFTLGIRNQSDGTALLAPKYRTGYIRRRRQVLAAAAKFPGGNGVGQGAVGHAGPVIQPRGQPLQGVAAAAKTLAGHA